MHLIRVVYSLTIITPLMGNVFSKNESLTQILISLDGKINNTEKRIENIQKYKAKTLNYFYFLTVLITPVILSYYYFENHSYADYAILLSLLVIIKILLSYAFQLTARKYERKLEKLIEQQKMNIEKLMQQEKYKETKEIIAKYEKPKILNTTKKKKAHKDLIDTLADAVLGNEEEMYALICKKCFAHNGMIHPSQINLEKFACCKCGETTVLREENNEN